MQLASHHPSKFFSALQSFCCRLSVVLLSCDSRSTLIRRDRTKKIGRAGPGRHFIPWMESVGLLPGQFFFIHPVVFESIYYRTTAKQLKYKSKTTGWLTKIGRVLLSRPIVFLPPSSSRSYCQVLAMAANKSAGDVVEKIQIDPFKQACTSSMALFISVCLYLGIVTSDRNCVLIGLCGLDNQSRMLDWSHLVTRRRSSVWFRKKRRY